MMDEFLLRIIALSPVIVGSAVALAAAWFAVQVLLDRGEPVTRPWEPGELLGRVGMHENPERAADTGHIPRHNEESVPFGWSYGLSRLPVIDRAMQLTRELRNQNWRPTRPYRTRIVLH